MPKAQVRKEEAQTTEGALPAWQIEADELGRRIQHGGLPLREQIKLAHRQAKLVLKAQTKVLNP